MPRSAKVDVVHQVEFDVVGADANGPETTAMPTLACEVGLVERALSGWFPNETFIRAATIGDYPILPEEHALVMRAVDRRRREFATGRWLAREGLRHFGLPDQPILMGTLKDPLWPQCVIGTISHDGDLCAVALRRKGIGPVCGIGMDLILLPQRAGTMDALASMFMANAGESDSVALLNVPVEPALLLFSLKESVIKAMASRLDDFIDMRMIEIRAADTFAVHVADRLIEADLFAAVTGGYLVTAVNLR
jgi:enterobactin synthetase component D